MGEGIVYLLTSFWLGAVHAATPGHGKTIAASYIVGVRGRPVDALVLGIFVTLSHTSGIVLVAVLATLGSAAPFIGLFGTVWGIMRSFEGIAAANSTSLAVVAPGIAEALFATAMGLAAAIPAVVAYNKITVDLGRFAGRMQGLIGRSGGLLARAGAEA